MAGPRAARDYPAGTADHAPPPLADAALTALSEAGLDVDVTGEARAEHGRDWWPVSLLDVAAGRVPSWPGAVVRAHDEREVAATLDVCSRRRIPVTAQGGRTSVVGGAQPREGAIALDLTGLDQVGPIDEVSGLVRAGAGVFGPDLERHAGAAGLTVGHFPQSFDFSTVGGWIASRGAGQFSNRYGTIADLVRGLRVVLANGRVLELTNRAPRASQGPDLAPLFVGSEGTLGVITEATLLARPAPDYRARRAFAVTDFLSGLEVCRRVLRRGASPAVLRLYDATEAERLFHVDDVLLLALDEGDETMCRATLSVLDDEASALAPRDPELVDHWLEHRNDVSALAPLWERGVVVDTIEVAASWSRLGALHDALLEALRSIEGTVMASVHQSHAYLDGACLYVTFAGTSDDPRAYYERVWRRAMDVAITLGALSHHHGVGRVRAAQLPAALGAAYDVLGELKELFDPLGILNPGVQGLGVNP